MSEKLTWQEAAEKLENQIVFIKDISKYPSEMTITLNGEDVIIPVEFKDEEITF